MISGRECHCEESRDGRDDAAILILEPNNINKLKPNLDKSDVLMKIRNGCAKF